MKKMENQLDRFKQHPYYKKYKAIRLTKENQEINRQILDIADACRNYVYIVHGIVVPKDKFQEIFRDGTIGFKL